MNVDAILQALNESEVDYILIGGMNFLIRHIPELTFDVDIWVADLPANLTRLNEALRKLGASWGPSEKEWAPVPENWRWLERQGVFCLTTAHGALDIFRDVRGLEGQYTESRRRAIPSSTSTGVAFLALADGDMLACQEALPPSLRKATRMEVLRKAMEKAKTL